ncbi:MAG: hypothetical protein H6817_01250 [Phycisphaerales bacterium]|nr:hypothetical protein [Phycisphaerales bacterium]
MIKHAVRFQLILAIILLLAVPRDAFAEFELVDDFESATIGPVDDQSGWIAADDTSVVVADPANPDNQVLAVTTDSTHLRHDLLLVNGTTRMLYLRFRFGGQQTFSFGMSDSSFPDQFGEFEVELGMSNASNELRINDDGTYEDLILLEPDVWYNVWILIDNLNDESRVYLHTALVRPASVNDMLDADGQLLFTFRDGTAGDLRTFFIKTGGGSSGNSGPLYLDDIYLENTNALNLHNPTVLPPDFDDDGDVDLFDHARFVDCLNGPEVATPPPGCSAFDFELADLEHDRDVDLRDFAAFVELFDVGAL